MCRVTKSLPFLPGRNITMILTYWECGAITHSPKTERAHRWAHFKFWWRKARRWFEKVQ